VIKRPKRLYKLEVYALEMAKNSGHDEAMEVLSDLQTLHIRELVDKPLAVRTELLLEDLYPRRRYWFGETGAKLPIPTDK